MTLAARRCAACATLTVGRRACLACGAEGGQDVTLTGRGRLVSWTVIRVAPARYAADAPYSVGVVALDEGPRLTARITGDPESLAAGQPLALAADDPARGPIFTAA